MRGISTVLCAVDGGEPGRAALAQALALARVCDATLLIVQAVPLERSFNADAAKRVTYLQALSATARAAGVDARVSVQSGRAPDIILLHARARAVSLIVVSLEHGVADGWAAGSIAEEVLRDAESPTLVVPGPAVSYPLLRGFDDALCAVTLQSDSARQIEGALALLDDDHSRVVLCHVIPSWTGRAAACADEEAATQDPEGRAMRRLQALVAASNRRRVLGRVAVGQVARELVRTARACGAALIVITARRRTRIGRRLRGITRRLLLIADRPVLAVPERPTATAGTVSQHAA